MFPESAPNSEFARYLYYLGRIEAIQLEYSAAIDNIEQAIRKAPRNAVGFLQASTKLMVIVKMLLGNIPTRDVFRTESLRRSLIPYFELTQAVRIGDLSKFSAVIDKYGTHVQKNVDSPAGEGGGRGPLAPLEPKLNRPPHSVCPRCPPSTLPLPHPQVTSFGPTRTTRSSSG